MQCSKWKVEEENVCCLFDKYYNLLVLQLNFTEHALNIISMFLLTAGIPKILFIL